MNRPTTDQPVPLWSVHVPGVVVTVVGLVVMVTASVVAWPDMAVEIVTREAAGRHGESVVRREVSAVVPPLALAGLAVLFALGPGLEQRFAHLSPLLQDGSPERQRRVLGWTIAGLSIVLTVLHLGILALHTAEPFPLEQAVGAAAGLVLVLIGVVLPLAAPGGRFPDGPAEASRAAQGPAYRIAGPLLALAGLATAVLALLGSGWAVVVAVGGILVAFGFVAARAGIAAWRARPSRT